MNNQSSKSSQTVTDWENVFETPPDGLIPVINSANSAAALKKCMAIVIEYLFSRDGDDQSRASYAAALDELLHDNVNQENLSKIKKATAGILRSIKDQRKRKAAMFIEQQANAVEKTNGAASGIFDEDRLPEDSDAPLDHDAAAKLEARLNEEQGAEEAPKEIETDATRRIFADVCWDVVHQRLKVAQKIFPEEKHGDGSLPFILSTKFTAKFEPIIRKHVIPEMVTKCRGVIIRASHAKEEQQYAAMHDAFEDKKGRELLWGAWQLAWDEVMYEKEVPPKPEGKKGGMMMNILKREKKKPSWKSKELTTEEWVKTSNKIKAANKRAREIWKNLLEDTGEYQPPVDADGLLLKELFGRSATGLRKQIDAIRQIAEQGGNIGKAFDAFQRGKNLDLALLAASYQYPDIFINNPKQQIIKSMLGGFSDSQRKQYYGLVVRYLRGQL